MNQNILTYEGQVEVKYIIKGKTYTWRTHNEGLPPMFRFLCKALTGNFSSLETERPAFLDIKCQYYQDNNTTPQYESCLYSKLSLSNPEYAYNTDLGTWLARFQIVLSYNMINYETLKEYSTSKIYLYLISVLGDEFARLELDTSKIKLTELVPGTQALVEWTMIIKNATETTTESTTNTLTSTPVITETTSKQTKTKSVGKKRSK